MKIGSNGALRFDSVIGLQVGNKVLHKGTQTVISAIGINSVIIEGYLDTWINVSELEPILLTPELAVEALKSVFYDAKIINEEIVFKKSTQQYSDTLTIYKVDKEYRLLYEKILIEYLHQLQNIIPLFL